MTARDQGIVMELRQPVRGDHDRRPEGSTPGWLAELREMRGRIWHDGGRRPFFLQPDGSFVDADPADLHAYHIVARLQGRAIGCSRIVPLSKGRPSFVVATLGEERIAQLLGKFAALRERTCEASRWVVVPEHRNGLGARIAMATWAVARRLSLDIAFVLACTSEGQDRALMRLGARPVPGLGTFRREDFLEDGRLLYFDVQRPSDFMRRHMDELPVILNLDALLPIGSEHSAVA
jgi:hypothetical protein